MVIKYNEPPEARIPKRRWRLYPFKNDDPLPVMYIHRQSAYLLGRQRRIADIPIDHPSCSKQHAVFQYRWEEYLSATVIFCFLKIFLSYFFFLCSDLFNFNDECKWYTVLCFADW